LSIVYEYGKLVDGRKTAPLTPAKWEDSIAQPTLAKIVD
jgi:hypothetical protein